MWIGLFLKLDGCAPEQRTCGEEGSVVLLSFLYLAPVGSLASAANAWCKGKKSVAEVWHGGGFTRKILAIEGRKSGCVQMVRKTERTLAD